MTVCKDVGFLGSLITEALRYSSGAHVLPVPMVLNWKQFSPPGPTPSETFCNVCGCFWNHMRPSCLCDAPWVSSTLIKRTLSYITTLQWSKSGNWHSYIHLLIHRYHSNFTNWSTWSFTARGPRSELSITFIHQVSPFSFSLSEFQIFPGFCNFGQCISYISLYGLV